MSKKFFLVMVISILFILPLTAQAQTPPMPARIGGTVTVDGTQLTQSTDTGYTFLVTKESGAPYVPPAEDADGLNVSDWYVIDVPIYDAIEQPGGANQGDTAVIHVYKNGSELTVTIPGNAEFKVGDSGSDTQIDLEALSCCTDSYLVITKEADTASIPVDDPDDPNDNTVDITYTIEVNNTGTSDAENVTLTDDLPTELTGAEYSTDGGTIWSVWTSPLSIGTIIADDSLDILIRGTLHIPKESGTIPNTATVQEGEDGCPESASIDIRICPKADLGIEKKDDSGDFVQDYPYPYGPPYYPPFHDPVIAGESTSPHTDPPLTYAIWITNYGPSDAANVILEDNLPSCLGNIEYRILYYDSGTSTWQWTTNWTTFPADGKIFLDTIPFQPDHNYKIVEIKGDVKASTPPGTITNNASVSSGAYEPDPDPHDNSTFEDTVANTEADLSVIKTGPSGTVYAGEDITYTITVANAGPSDADNVILTDTAPSELLNPDYKIGSSDWKTLPEDGKINLGTIPATDPATEITIEVKGRIDPCMDKGDIANKACLTSDTEEINEDNNCYDMITKVDTSADISVTKTPSSVPVIAGKAGETICSIRVENPGPSCSKGITLTEHLPSEISPSTAEYRINYYDSSSSTWEWTDWDSLQSDGQIPLGTISPDDPSKYQIVEIRGTVAPSTLPGFITNYACITSDTLDPGNDNNCTNDVDIEVTTEANIYVIKADDGAKGGGELLTYTITIGNYGPSDAQNVKLTDALPQEIDPPDGFSYPQYSIEYSNGGSLPEPQDQGYPNWKGSINLGKLAFGEEVNVYIKGIINPETRPGTITNSVCADSITIGSLKETKDPDEGNNCDTLETTINYSADLEVIKSDLPDPVIAGEMLTYTIKVTNKGPSAVSYAMLEDTLDTFTDPDCPDDVFPVLMNTVYSIPPDTDGKIKLGPILKDESVIVTITGRVDPGLVDEKGEPEKIINIASVSSEDNPETDESEKLPDPIESNNTYTIYTEVIAEADLSIVKEDMPEPVRVGNELLYTLKVNNNGPSYAREVIVTDDKLPKELLNRQYRYSLGDGNTWTDWKVWVCCECIGTLGVEDPGQCPSPPKAVMEIKGTIDPDTCAGIINNTAKVNSPTADPENSNNSAYEETIVKVVADLGIVKTDAPDPVKAGNELIYTVTVTNHGPNDAVNAILTDTPPDALDDVNYSIDGGPWIPFPEDGKISLGNINVSDPPKIVKIKGKVKSSTSEGTAIKNIASITSDAMDPDPDNHSNQAEQVTAVNTSADLGVTKTDNADPDIGVIAGNELKYTITVTNNGPSDAQNVSLTDNLPAELTGAEYSTDGGTTWSPWKSPLSIGTITAGSSTEPPVLIKGTIATSAIAKEITNTATVGSGTDDANPVNNSSVLKTKIQSNAELSITKEDSPDPVKAGKELTYNITITNNGPSDASNVALTDDLPAELTGAEYSTDGGTTWSPWKSPLSIGTITAGSSPKNVLIMATVASSVIIDTVITNTASVNSDSVDPNPSNNNVSAGTAVKAGADLAISKIDDSEGHTVIAGNNITYTITIINNGPLDAENVVLTDTIPTGIQGAEFSLAGQTGPWSNWTGSYEFGTMQKQESKQIWIKGTVSADGTGTINNTAYVTADTADDSTANNTASLITTIKGSADLSIEKTGPDSTIAGDKVTYTITVTNAGTSDAVNVVLTDDVPSGINDPEYSTGTDNWTAWTGSLNLGTITTGNSRITLIRGTVDVGAPEVITNAASVSSDTEDPNLNNNSDSVDTENTIEDTDQDGLPDAWEIEYFGDLEQGPDDDFDGDGFTNLEEFNGETSPVDENDYPTRPYVITSDCSPYDGQGVQDGTLRVPNDTSVVIRVKDDTGIDEASIQMTVKGEAVSPVLKQLAAGDPKDYWVIYYPASPFGYEEVIDVTLTVSNVDGIAMETYSYNFKVESQQEHFDALANIPDSTLDDSNPEEYILSANAGTDIEGAVIKYNPTETATPRFGPVGEIPEMTEVNGVGLPVALEPPTVFENPVTIFIPCPGETDVSTLDVYYYNPAEGWVKAGDADGWMVPGSRVDHNDTTPPTVEVQANHFSAAQAGKVEGEGGGGSSGGSGGSCFIATAAFGSYMEPHVKVLRDFRDDALLSSEIGRGFVNLYYAYSPPIADFIARHDALRMMVRWSLLPLIGISWMLVNFGTWFSLMLIAMLALIGSTLYFAGRRMWLKHPA